MGALKNPRSLSWLIAALATAPLLAAEEKRAAPLEIGDAAVDFRLRGVDDKEYSLADFADHRVLAVFFTCNHCPTAQLYEDRFNRLVADYKPRGVGFVAISPNDPKAVRLDELGYTDLGDSFDEMKIRAREKRFDFPYLYDGDAQETSRAYGPRATPHLFIFDRDRRLRYSGRIDNSESGNEITRRDAREALDALLQGKPVPVETTRAFGCSIKWADKREDNRRWMEKVAAEPVMVTPISADGVKKLRANKGKKLRLINVWATWCGPCLTEFPDLVKTNLMYRHRAFEFVSISIDLPRSSKEVMPTLQKFRASSRNHIFDSEDRDPLAEALDEKWSGSIPLTLLIKPGGEIVYRREGRIDPLELRKTIVKNLGPWRE